MAAATTTAARRLAWKRIFQDPLVSPEYLREKGLAGAIDGDDPRSFYWKIFLEVIPSSILTSDAWRLILDKERRGYTELKEKYIFDPSKLKEATDWSLNNPLSLADESPWKQYFADVDLRKMIMQDVERTFPDQECFRDENIQALLCNILFIYCKINPDISYRQGMHELLAVVFLVVDKDKVDHNDPAATDEAFKIMFNAEFIEHDTATIFFRIMRSVKIWYEVNEGQPSFVRPGEPKSRQPPKTVPIVAACKRIHHDLLGALDPELARHLESHNIEPQLYGLRWLRLLFVREFPLSHAFKLWDGIFAEDANLGIVEWVAVAMLVYIRREVLASDYTETMQLLMKFPSSADVASSEFIASAKGLRERYRAKVLAAASFPLRDSAKGDLLSESKGISSLHHSRAKRSTAPWVAYAATSGDNTNESNGSKRSSVAKTDHVETETHRLASASASGPGDIDGSKQGSSPAGHLDASAYPSSPSITSPRASIVRQATTAVLRHVRERDQHLSDEVVKLMTLLSSWKTATSPPQPDEFDDAIHRLTEIKTRLDHSFENEISMVADTDGHVAPSRFFVSNTGRAISRKSIDDTPSPVERFAAALTDSLVRSGARRSDTELNLEDTSKSTSALAMSTVNMSESATAAATPESRILSKQPEQTGASPQSTAIANSTSVSTSQHAEISRATDDAAHPSTARVWNAAAAASKASAMASSSAPLSNPLAVSFAGSMQPQRTTRRHIPFEPFSQTLATSHSPAVSQESFGMTLPQTADLALGQIRARFAGINRALSGFLSDASTPNNASTLYANTTSASNESGVKRSGMPSAASSDVDEAGNINFTSGTSVVDFDGYRDVNMPSRTMAERRRLAASTAGIVDSKATTTTKKTTTTTVVSGIYPPAPTTTRAATVNDNLLADPLGVGAISSVSPHKQ